MSSKINHPLPFPVIVKPDQSVGSAGVTPAQNNDRSKPQKNSSSSSSGTKRHPAPLDLQKPMPLSFTALEMEKEDFSVLETVLADQVTFEITQLYSLVENISRDNNSLEVRQGLKALEEQVKLREYLHAKRTVINNE